MPPQAMVDITPEDLPDIKPVTISRLKRIGVKELAAAMPQKIANEAGKSLDIATPVMAVSSKVKKQR